MRAFMMANPGGTDAAGAATAAPDQMQTNVAAERKVLLGVT
jgi:hypothetical protein